MRSFKFVCASHGCPVLEAILVAESISNRDLANRLGWSECRTSRHVDQLVAQGRVVKIRSGKAVDISVA